MKNSYIVKRGSEFVVAVIRAGESHSFIPRFSDEFPDAMEMSFRKATRVAMSIRGSVYEYATYGTADERVAACCEDGQTGVA